MSRGRDDDDPPKGPNVLMVVPDKDGGPDRLYTRDRDSDGKRELTLCAVNPCVVVGYTIIALVPTYNIDHNAGLDTYTGQRARGIFTRDVNTGFAAVIQKNHFCEEMIAKMEQLAELTGDNCEYSILAGCDDGKIRLFNFTFDREKFHSREVETFDEPVVFFPNHYYRTKAQLVKTLQDRVDRQVADLQRYFDPEFYQMNFAGFQ